jgi:hypothetical protein
MGMDYFDPNMELSKQDKDARFPETSLVKRIRAGR